MMPARAPAGSPAAGRPGRAAPPPKLGPYPPGVPVAVTGGRLGPEAVKYLRTDVEATMYVPDTADPSLRTLRVVADERDERG
ncbi:hypothetical protein H180DRAFT_03582 [Streptomyces sp. WMMB 322]|nr:hypothetical protein H180DRAFT_03582 [Streptomyces sp. WMMB 322]